jgi:hypothetical protein
VTIIATSEADSAQIWLPCGVRVGSGVSEVQGSLCDYPSDRVREPLRSLKCSNRSFHWGLTHELTRRMALD